jgi:CBS domain-containing protein
MAMLSELLYFDLIDSKNRRARLADLSLDLLKGDYPHVSTIYFNFEDELRETAWSDLIEADYGRKSFRIPDLEAAPVADQENSKEVFLRRDILDALVIDLVGRRTTRVGDLMLERDEDQLRLTAADSGLSGMLRRITRGRLGRVDKNSMFDWKYVEFLRGDPQAVRNGAGYRMRIGRLPAGEIARIADYVPYLHAAELLKLLPDEKAADVLAAMSVERQLQVIEELEEDEAVALLIRMSPDLATDLVGRLHVDTMKRYLSLMPYEKSNRIIELLRYPENSVGGVMINDIIWVTSDMEFSEASRVVRESLRKAPFASLIFVVDHPETRKLVGAIPLRDILITDETKTLDQTMDPYLETLDPYQDATDAAHRIVGGQLHAMPVIVDEGRLIGAMTIDAAISQLLPASSVLQTLRVFS